MKSGAQSLLTRVIFVVIVVIIVASYVLVELKKCEVTHGLVFKSNELGSIDRALYDAALAVAMLIVMGPAVAMHAGITTSRIPALIAAVTDPTTPKFITRLEKSRGSITGAAFEASGPARKERRFQWLQEFVSDIELVYISANRTCPVPVNSFEIVATEKHYKTQM